MVSPNLEAFRKFLLDQKTCVTRVTCVTTKENNDLAGYDDRHVRVTRVTEIAGSVLDDPDVDERQAIVEVEGGVSPLYSGCFAKLQLTPPPGLSVERWLQAVDDAGRFLDAFGGKAEALGWTAEDLFAPTGLIRALASAHVTMLTADRAVLSDGRTFSRNSDHLKRGHRHG